MKEHWERTQPPFTLTLAQIDELVRPAFPDSWVRSAQLIGDGLSNTNYFIQLNDLPAPYLLRLYRGGKDIAEKEHALAHLLGKRIPIPSIYFTDWSCTQIDQPWAIVEWKDGSLLRDIRKSKDPEVITAAAASVGKTLAHIHSYRFQVAGFFGKDLQIKEPIAMDPHFFLAFVEDSLFAKQTAILLGEPLAHALWTFCQHYAPLLGQHQDSPVLVHSDFNGLNILLEENQTCSVSAVLDWEFAFAGSRLIDIGNLLRYEEHDSLFATYFIHSYLQARGTLPEDWQLRSRLEDVIALCDLLNHSTMKMPNRVNDLKRLINRTVQSYPVR